MKKSKMIFMMVLGLNILLLAGCGKKLGEEFTDEVNTLTGVSLTVDEDKVSETGVAYTIYNQSYKDISF